MPQTTQPKKKKVLILTDTLLGAKGIKNLITNTDEKIKVKILPIQEGTIDKINKFSPSTIIYYRYKLNGIGQEVFNFFSKKSDVDLITVNLDTNKMVRYFHETVFDAQLKDLFSTLKVANEETFSTDYFI